MRPSLPSLSSLPSLPSGLAGLAIALAGLMVACEEEAAGPAPAVVDEANALRLVIVQDPAQGPLQEVERAMTQRRPVLAAQLLRTGAIPAARRQVERVEATRVREAALVAARRRTLAAYRDRVAALERYERVLVRGGTDDAELAASLHDQSAAERELLTVLTGLDLLVPLPEGEREAEGPPEEPHATPPATDPRRFER